MSIKTIIIIVITVLLTTVLMQNTDQVKFTILFGDIYLSKLVVLGVITVIAFILGILVGRPKKQEYDIGAYHDQIHKDEPNTLSDEDRDYIN